ncbi:PEP-CTERM sorting domain-containing protein [Massilia genomosp. 1]|uniref:PEP-CTERM sorting domain-containing protein n=1 Tax=Massilia genomosp. 1 TaxID=2609280 RepID=UPI001C9E6796|nr:PEP-CTERM sorting domain-containing protein [Massilia genomosp. 1]
MHPHFNKRTLCALAALAAAWVPAQANTSTASASIAQFQYRLVDLDLNDGIDPSITFGVDTRWLSTTGDGQTEQISASGTTSIVTQFGAAGGTLSDTALLSHASLNHSLPVDKLRHEYRNEGKRVGEFILSPNTELIFTAVGKIAQQRDGGLEGSESRIAMRAYLLDANGEEYRQFDKSYEVINRNASATINLYGSLRSDATQRNGQFSFNAYTSLMGVTPPVPEPSTYAMLLAGAAVVGAVARRRRKAAATPAA